MIHTSMTGPAVPARTAKRIVIGMFTYNEEKYLEEAVDSLLGQTYKDFTLTISDDCSTDSTWEIIKGFARADDRIIAHRKNRRGGYGANYRTSFALAGEAIEYFAWAAGHDRHHPEWLARMTATLDAVPDAVMTYPLTVRIDGEGKELDVPSPRFDTTGLDVQARIDKLGDPHQSTGFGDMVYGLFRAEALRKARIFPLHVFPDVRLLVELMLYGSFSQIEEPLWYRRFCSPMSPAQMARRQRTRVFARTPLYARIPWPLAHYLSLLYHTVLKPTAGGLAERRLGAVLCNAYRRRFFFKLRRCENWL